MTIEDYLSASQSEGQSISQAVQKLARITGCGERSCWRWVKGCPPPPYATRLLTIWADATPAQRSRWFGSAK